MRRRGESAAMVSEAEIVRHLISVLEKADFNTTTTTAIRKQLEIELGVDLSEKKTLIRQQVDLYLAQQQQQQFGSNEAEQGEQYQEEEDGNRREEGEEEEQEGIDDEEVDVEYEGVEDVKSHVLAAGVSHGAEEVDSKRTRAKIDRAIKERIASYNGSFSRVTDIHSKQMRAKIYQAIKESLSKEKKKRVSSGGGGLSRVCGLSPELQAIVGQSELPRTEVVKQLWIYIRENSLQDPDNKRKIICDDALQTLFGTDSTDMFKMNKLLSKHIWPLENGSAQTVRKKERDNDTEDAEPKPKKHKTDKSEGGKSKNSGFLAPIPISEALAGFLGAVDGKVSRADAVKRLWDYIKENNLQDPANKKMIVCDDRLQELFGVDTFVGFSMSKLLSPHFIKS